MDGSLHGSKVCRTAPAVSHLLFADDCLLFCYATTQECTRLRSLLDEYEAVSEQAINYNKLGVFFSKNIDNNVRDLLSNILGERNLLNTGTLLGYSIFSRQEEKGHFPIYKGPIVE